MATAFYKKGFTLIELLIFITVLSILITTSYLLLPPLITKAYDAHRKADLNKIKINLEVYYDFAGQYPEELPSCGQPLVYRTQKILPSFPCDPTTKEPYYYQIKKDDLHHYRLYALLINDQDFSISDVGCAGGCGPDCFYNYGVASTNVALVKCSFVCAPGGGSEGSCERYQDTSGSICPTLYGEDSTCGGECGDSENRCENASGKKIPL